MTEQYIYTYADALKFLEDDSTKVVTWLGGVHECEINKQQFIAIIKERQKSGNIIPTKFTGETSHFLVIQNILYIADRDI